MLFSLSINAFCECLDQSNTDTSLCDTLVLWWKPWGNTSQAAHIHAKGGQLSWQPYFGHFAIILRTSQQDAAKDLYNHG